MLDYYLDGHHGSLESICDGVVTARRCCRGPRAATLPEMTEQMRAAVLGAGSWGTAFAKVLVDAGSQTTLWARRPELAVAIESSHRNEDYLPGIDLPPALRATHDFKAALADVDLVALAIPSQTLRENLAVWAPYVPPGATVVSLMKGVELGTAKRMSEVIAEVGGIDPARIAVLSGPNLAREIALEQPTATVVACTDEVRCKAVQDATANSYFRPYTNDDVIGCELAGAIKNVIALACGMVQGMGLGDNTVASLITRGLAETARLGVALGADPLTFAGLAGLGDLVASCSSPLARNRSFGERLGRGDSMAQAQQAMHGQVAEGVKSCRAVLDLAQRHNIEVPITRAVEAVCYQDLSPQVMVHAMMTRAMKSE
jgi:glycerol-3-phosphate dehydrogenase (NAD(P)+)